MKRPTGLPPHTSTYGHYVVLPMILFAFALEAGQYFGAVNVVFGGLGFGVVYLSLSMFGLLLLVYVLWLLLVIRGKLTAATGGGLVLSAYALAARALASAGEGVLPWYGRWLLGHKPIYGQLDLIYDLSVVAYVFGIALVVASAIAEWRLRREAPDWALPE